nr:polyprenyl synthetase family protein [uncultured Holophaga sp.]
MKRLSLLRYFAPIQPRLSAVEEELQHILSSDIPLVQKLADHVQRGQGKRLRPALVLLSSRFCGDPVGLDVKFGAIFELVHTATLVHDDVIDHALVRRAEPTVNALWGNTLTVLFGDLLYLNAMSSAIQGRSWRMMEIFAEVTTRMIEGELLQNHVLFKLATTRQDYFDIQERKTALLFSGCTESGAVLAGRPEADALAMRRYGLEIGRAFQLVDDLLDYTATSEQLGKPAFSDLREGKLTLPMLTLLDRAPEARSLVERIWAAGESAPISQEDEGTLRSLLEAHDALAETRELARRASQAARESLQGVQGDKGIRKLLLEIPEVLLERSR